MWLRTQRMVKNTTDRDPMYVFFLWLSKACFYGCSNLRIIFKPFLTPTRALPHCVRPFRHFLTGQTLPFQPDTSPIAPSDQKHCKESLLFKMYHCSSAFLSALLAPSYLRQLERRKLMVAARALCEQGKLTTFVHFLHVSSPRKKIT